MVLVLPHHGQVHVARAAPAVAPRARRLSVAHYGAPNTNVSADDIALFQEVGITDAWIPYLAGAFAVDCCKPKPPGAYAHGGLH